MHSAEVRDPGPVLVLAPSGRDAAVISSLIGDAGISTVACPNLSALVAHLRAGDGGAALIAQEALHGDIAMLIEWISAQPSWSDFPFVLLTFRDLSGRREVHPPTRLAAMLGNATVLERPLHPVSLISAVGAALRARSRQLETEALLQERDRHAAALRGSEARFRAIVDGMPQPIWSARADGTLDFFNARWLEVTGSAPPMRDGVPEAVEQLYWKQMLHEEDADRTREEWEAAVRSGQPFRSEFRMRMADGSWHWFTGRALPVHDDISGEIVRWFGSCTDIDQSVRAREALARSTEELEQLVSQRTASLQREMLEREKAETALAQAQKMEAVGQLTGGVAHDFNNLLTAVLGNLQMIGKHSADPQIQRFADNARRAAERGARLTQQLLAFSRRQRLVPEPVDLPRLIGGINDLLTRAVGATITLETRCGEDLPPAFVDPTQMELVLLNLAINARDAMPDGGVLTISCGALPTVPEELAADLAPGSYLAITVTDVGSGMTPEVQERAFEPFFTTKEQGKGTGLGLSQVYGFVRQSGGVVKLRSAPGQGTTVTLYLPRAQTLPGEETIEPLTTPAPILQANILVVDDDDDVRDLVVTMLEELGYHVTAAEDGRRALDLLQRNGGYDLLLADVAMPGLSGVDVVREARQIGRAPRVLYATGYADLGSYRTGLEGEDMIRKPYRMADLAARVDRALRAPLGRNAPRASARQ